MRKHHLRFRAADRDKFVAIRDGVKTIETRAGSVAHQKIQHGDMLIFSCGPEKIEKIVTQIGHFKSVKEAFASPDFSKILPGVKTLSEAEAIYHGFEGYEEKIAKHGLLAFHLKADTIRPLTATDARPVQSLAEKHLRKYYGAQFKAVQIWLLSTSAKHAWVYEPSPGKIGGFVVVDDKPAKDYIKLSSLLVDKPYRQHGMGHVLLEEAIDHARTTHKSKLILTVAEDNGISKEFFEHAGFELVGRIDNKYRPGKAELVYCLLLRS
jgi:ribosomal protein S18 acetylase RimI-like enzyme/ASC-1-like (ASCH) protein